MVDGFRCLDWLRSSSEGLRSKVDDTIGEGVPDERISVGKEEDPSVAVEEEEDDDEPERSEEDLW